MFLENSFLIFHSNQTTYKLEFSLSKLSEYMFKIGKFIFFECSPHSNDYFSATVKNILSDYSALIQQPILTNEVTQINLCP